MGNKSQHTPAPWTMEDNHLVNMDSVEHIAEIRFGLDGDSESDTERHEADARLIVAAPELLAACESALCAYEVAGKGDDDNSTARQLRAAIARARGEQGGAQ